MNLLHRFQAGRYARQLAMDGASETTVAQAKSQLVAMGPSAIRSILDSLQGVGARGPALEVLESLLSPRTLPTFVEALSSQNPAVVDAVTTVLSRGQNYDPSDLLPLFSEPKVSKARLESILAAQMQRLQPRTLLKVLPDLSRDARGSVFRLVEKTADGSIVADAVQLAVHTEWWLRLHMAKLLARVPSPEGAEAVIKLLQDENPSVRLEAVRCLATLKSHAAIPALCQRLRDSDIKVQTAAIEALVVLNDVSAVPHLIDHLKDENEYVRRGAVEVLNQVVTVDAIKDLVNALRDADWWVRVRAADALGSLGGERVVDAVIALVNDGDDFVRRYAVEILNTVTDPRAVEPLIHALEDDDWWVRERAVDALAKARDARAVDPLLRMLGRDGTAVPLVIKALAAIADPRVVEPICRLVSSQNTEVRREAVQALTLLNKTAELDPDARRYLQETLESVGVHADRTKIRPLEVRGGFGPESDRPAEVQRRATEEGVEHASGSGPSPSGETKPAPRERMLNFQQLDPGTVLNDRYRVVERIGGGGFGTVYLVEDVVVREELVLKILAPHLSLDANMIRRFVQELRLTRRITHKNVIRIYDLLDLEGAHGISMEYFAGRDLGHVLRRDGPLSAARVARIATQVLEGLVAAHELGIIHRDIKPANILVGDDDITKIVDFGLASVGQSTKSRLTASGILVGTPEYISPEQITGQAVDGRTDLYSLGTVMYELLSGKPPFGGENAVNVLFQHLESTIPPIADAVPGVPRPLSDLVAAAMSRSMDARPLSAAEMLERLQKAA